MRDQFDISGVFETTEFEIAQVACNYYNHTHQALSYEPVREKTNDLGSDQVRHKPGSTVTEDG